MKGDEISNKIEMDQPVSGFFKQTLPLGTIPRLLKAQPFTIPEKDPDPGSLALCNK